MDYDFAPEGSTYQIHNQENSSQSGQHTAIASGDLHKLAHGKSLKVWHRRYYVLYSDGLVYSYLNARSKKSHRIIPVGRLCLKMKFGQETINGECGSWPSSVPVEHRLSIINADRTYHFYSESETELSKWKHYLQSTMDRLSSPSQNVLDNDTSQNTDHTNTPEDTIRIGDPYDSSISSSEESIQFTHRTQSPVEELVEKTFGEITAFLVDL